MKFDKGSLSPRGKGDEENRLGKVAVSQNALDYSLTFPKGPAITLHVEMEGDLIAKTHLSLSDTFSCAFSGEGAPPYLLEWLDSYLNGIHPLCSIPPTKTKFQQEVLQALQKVPFGHTISYQQLAYLCARPTSIRAVGSACGRNPLPLLIPCHRIIRSNGEIGGFALDLEIKKRLLKFEAGRSPAS